MAQARNVRSWIAPGESVCPYCRKEIGKNSVVMAADGIEAGHVGCFDREWKAAMEFEMKKMEENNEAKAEAEIERMQKAVYGTPYEQYVRQPDENFYKVREDEWRKKLEAPADPNKAGPDFFAFMDQVIRRYGEGYAQGCCVSYPPPAGPAAGWQGAVEIGKPSAVEGKKPAQEKPCGPWPTFRVELPVEKMPRAERIDKFPGRSVTQQSLDFVKKELQALALAEELRFKRTTREWPWCRHGGTVSVKWDYSAVMGTGKGSFQCSKCGGGK